MVAQYHRGVGRAEQPHQIMSILQEPILPSLLRLSAPNLLIVVATSATAALDGHWAGKEGSDALAALGIVFPFTFLTATIATNGIGGGAGAAVARALGAKKPEMAGSIACHALLIALAIGLVFTFTLLAGGPWFYALLGARGAALQFAIELSDMLFQAAPITWLFCMLNAIVRGSGNMRLPARMIAAGSIFQLIAAPSLMFGWWAHPLGIRGIGLAYILYHGLGCAVLGGYVILGRAGFSLSKFEFRLGTAWQILRVGLPASLNPLITFMSILVVTGLVARYGTASIAAYGLVARLEYIQAVLVSTIGAPLIFVVGACFGAGDRRRGLQWAWAGAGIAITIAGTIGIIVAVYPLLWLSFFTTDPAVMAMASDYLRIVGPTYAAYGAGIALYFASQGAGHVFWAMMAGIMRFVICAGVGTLVVKQWGGGLNLLFVIIAVAYVAFGAIVAIAVWTRGWGQHVQTS